MTAEPRGHTVELHPSSDRVRVEIDGRTVADSHRPILLHETGLPVRLYLPAADVDLSLFEPSDTQTWCPYKGTASYWTYRGAGDSSAAPLPDVAWSYVDPIEAVQDIRGHLSFADGAARVTREAG